MLSWAIIGCGLIGKKRAALLPKGALLWACDVDPGRASLLASSHSGCKATENAAEIWKDPAVQAVAICTLNGVLAPLALEAVQHGKHVIVEKPGAIHSSQLKKIRAAADRTGAKVRIGYNHRYHPALQKAKAIADRGEIGPLMFLRARYGHGGRVGYDREWRADPKLSGGGELIDQGVHLIDLSGWFLGDFPIVEGHATTSYWDMPVDDNAFMSLRTASNQTAWLHVSCSEWKNLFSLEIYGRAGKLQADGLGGSYGLERLTHYRMLPEMGPPETTSWEFPRGDESWKIEMREFEEDIAQNREPNPGLREGIRTLEIVEEIMSRSGYNFGLEEKS